jgi:hypothetical protein
VLAQVKRLERDRPGKWNGVDLPYFAGKEDPPRISLPLKLNTQVSAGRLLRRYQCVGNGKEREFQTSGDAGLVENIR